MSATARQPNFALLLVAAWLLVMLQLVAQGWAETAQSLLDTDDAMRLAQLRDWLGGQGWYDLNQYRVASGYESHWSRLIDAGLGGTLWVFGLFAGPAMAERLMRTVWPMLWLLPTMAGTAAIAWRIAGREAALVALLLALVGLPAFHQFRPGRIDHHNVQIALSVLAVAATVWSDRMRWAGLAAGALTGLALAIGLECLPYLMACAAAFAVRFAVDRTAARATEGYGLALAVSAIAAFFVIVPPAHWTRGVCDAIAVNWVALVVTGGLGLALAARLAGETFAVRLIWVVAIAGTAAALFVAIEPRCLRGPYAMMDPAVWPIWLAHVREMKPLLALIADSPVTGLAIAAFPAAALLATLVLLRDRALRRDFGFLAATAAFITAAVTTLAAIKSYSYATWLGMPLVAAFALHLFALLRLNSLVPRVALGMLLTPAVLSLGAITFANAAGLGSRADNSRPDADACYRTANFAALARLSPGLVAADIDYGPYLLALTRHSVLAAPYHRLSAGILTVHDIFAAEPDDALSLLQQRHVVYLLVCGARAPSDTRDAPTPGSLSAVLAGGKVPDWLEPLSHEGPMRLYRVADGSAPR